MVSLGTVTSSNIISQVWDNIYSLINTIPDPANRGISWILSAFPQERKGTADVYPMIVIDSPDAKGENLTFSHTKRQYTWRIPIGVYATRMETVDGMSNTVITTLNNNRASIETRGMNMLDVESTPTFHPIIGGQVIHEKRINVTVVGYV